jgi:hypothetical protein
VCVKRNFAFGAKLFGIRAKVDAPESLLVNFGRKRGFWKPMNASVTANSPNSLKTCKRLRADLLKYVKPQLASTKS